MPPVSAQEAWGVFERADCLYSGAEVEAAIARMAQDITGRLHDQSPLLVCIMNGGVLPFARLLTHLAFPLQTDYVHATRYGAGLTGGDLQWIAGPAASPQGRTVLLVDDILDEGITLTQIEARYRALGAKDVLKAVLVTKLRTRKQPVQVHYSALEVPDRYVFGYGMDYKGWLRNAHGIYAVAGT